MRLQALLIGLGQIGCGYDIEFPCQIDKPFSGQFTLSHARALFCHPQVQILAALDPVASARRRFSRCYGVPVFSDLDQLHQAMQVTHIDLVVLAVPPALQPSLVESLLEKIKPRLLLLEKPVAVSVAEAERINYVCESQPGLYVAVNYIRRYLPAVCRVSERLKSGEFGSFLYGQVTYGKGLLSNGSHFVNLAESWLGALLPHQCDIRGSSWAGFDSESTVTLRAALHNNAPLYIRSVGEAGLRAGELDLWFTKGRIRWDNDGTHIAIWPLAAAAVGDSHRSLAIEPERLPTEIEHYQHFVLDNLVQSLQLQGTSCIKCDLKGGWTTLNLLESASNAGD